MPAHKRNARHSPVCQTSRRQTNGAHRSIQLGLSERDSPVAAYFEEQQRMAEAVYDALFGLGRLQPLVDNDQVENIIITGCDNVRLELVDGTLLQASPVAESDEELIEFLVFLASRSEVNARPFSESQPRLHLRLDGGSRLAAAAWVTPRPSVVIRRHRLMEVTLDDLVARHTLSP